MTLGDFKVRGRLGKKKKEEWAGPGELPRYPSLSQSLLSKWYFNNNPKTLYF
jgi:hypothetical protein